jgi:cytidine deaminase
MNLSQETIKKLIDAAHQARENAYIPYSSYKVGAAVLTANDQIITGANVKGGSFNLICCGERMALLKALFDGHRKFKAVVTVTSNGATPCGSCRQVIYELCNDAPVIVANTEGSYKIYKASELLPHAFEDSKTKKKN